MISIIFPKNFSLYSEAYELPNLIRVIAKLLSLINLTSNCVIN